MKIVVLDGYTMTDGDLSWDALAALGEFVIYDRTPDDLIIERMKGAECVITNKTALSKEIIESSPDLKYIGVLATGYNIVDIEAAREANVVVSNVPNYSTDSVAQFVFALLLDICHKVALHNQTVKDGEWQNCADFCYWKSPLIELAGKTMGLIGYGKIGRRTAEIAKSFGMNVIAYHHRTPEGECENGVDFVSLDTLYKKADIISLHVPLFPETKGMIDKTAIEKMKDGAIIINTSRGALLDEQAVADALNTGKLAYFAADVVAVEPITADNPLLFAKNTVLTPHIAWAPFEARERLMNITVENVKQFLAGTPINWVNQKENN